MPIAEAVKAYVDAGFTDIAMVQVGDEGQTEFLDQAARPLLTGPAGDLGRYPGEVTLSADFPTLVASHHGVSPL